MSGGVANAPQGAGAPPDPPKTVSADQWYDYTLDLAVMAPTDDWYWPFVLLVEMRSQVKQDVLLPDDNPTVMTLDDVVVVLQPRHTRRHK
jgi:hypothetical protein